MINNKNNFIFLSSISVLTFLSLSLSVHRGYTYGTALLLLTTLLTIPLWWRYKNITKGCLWICSSFFCIALVDILKGISPTPNIADFERALKYLIAILILFYLMTYPPKPIFIWWGVALGAIGTGLVAIFYTWISPELLTPAHRGRASPYLNPIQYGNMSVLLSMLAICGLNTPKKMLKLVLLLAIILGVLASILSQSRGGWVAFTFTLLIFCVINFRKSYVFSRQFVAVCCFLGVVITVGYFSVGNIIQTRVNQSVQEVVLTYQQGKAGNGSVGQRFQMWEFAFHEGMKYPLLGATKTQLKQDKEQWIKEGKSSSAIIRYGHFHNEFINAFAKKGFLGLFALLILYLVPLYFFLIPYRHISRDRPELNTLRMAGFSHILMFMGFGLTEVSLDVYNSALLMFLIPLCFFYASYVSQLQKFIRVSIFTPKDY